MSAPTLAAYAAGNASHAATAPGCDRNATISGNVAWREYSYFSETQVAHTDRHAPRLGFTHLSGQGYLGNRHLYNVSPSRIRINA